MTSLLLRSVISKDASEDRISQLPDDLMDRILKFLDAREAARTALLSTQWRDVWLCHGRLVFDWSFEKLGTISNTQMGFGKMVCDILLLRSGHVKTFKLEIPGYGPEPTQSDLDVWCHYLSRNGIKELHICLTNGEDQPKYKLPVCIFSCPTITELTLGGFTIDFPANARLGSVFSCLTFLQLTDCVVSMHGANGTTPSFPNLEEVGFGNCVHIENLLTSAPKLRSLVVWNHRFEIDWEWFKSHFLAVTSLGIETKHLLFKHAGVAKPSFPTALNLELLYLYGFNFYEEAFTASLQLLKKCPNLLELGIALENKPSSAHVGETISRMLENPVGHA